jgi:hypothetical protein
MNCCCLVRFLNNKQDITEKFVFIGIGFSDFIIHSVYETPHHSNYNIFNYDFILVILGGIVNEEDGRPLFSKVSTTVLRP